MGLLAAGCPIIALMDPQCTISQLITTANNGYSIRPHDVPALQKLFLHLLMILFFVTHSVNVVLHLVLKLIILIKRAIRLNHFIFDLYESIL